MKLLNDCSDDSNFQQNRRTLYFPQKLNTTLSTTLPITFRDSMMFYQSHSRRCIGELFWSVDSLDCKENFKRRPFVPYRLARDLGILGVLKMFLKSKSLKR